MNGPSSDRTEPIRAIADRTSMGRTRGPGSPAPFVTLSRFCLAARALTRRADPAIAAGLAVVADEVRFAPRPKRSLGRTGFRSAHQR